MLEHVVVDPDAWWSHTQNYFTAEVAEAALAAKVRKWRQSYVEALSAGDYKPRSQRPDYAPAILRVKV